MRPIPPPEPPPARRTDHPLPPYRYVPGLHAHPLHEGGHGAPVPEDPEALFAYACDLFDQRYWWEAHEAWEGLWQREPPGTSERDLLQGLIQLAAALFKAWTGHPGGAQALLARGRVRLLRVADDRGPVVRGIDLPELVRRVELAVAGGELPALPRR